MFDGWHAIGVLEAKCCLKHLINLDFAFMNMSGLLVRAQGMMMRAEGHDVWQCGACERCRIPEVDTDSLFVEPSPRTVTCVIILHFFVSRRAPHMMFRELSVPGNDEGLCICHTSQWRTRS